MGSSGTAGAYPVSHISTASRIDNLAALLRSAEEIDKSLISTLQSAPRSLENRDLYENILRGAMSRRGFDFAEAKRLASQPYRKALSPRVVIDLDPELNKVRISIGHTLVLVIRKPVLLWDCSCLPDELGQLLRNQGHQPSRCRIHGHTRGKELMDLTTTEFVQLRYGKAKICWRQSRQFWPPSIDSVIMLRNLSKANIEGADSVLDLGCGSGILGISLALKHPSVRRLVMADWLLSPLIHAIVNAEVNLHSQALSCEILIGMFDDWPRTAALGPIDVLVSTPPYLPVAEGFDAIRKESPVAGTELMRFIICTRLARTTFLTVSSLVEEELKALAEAHDTEVQVIGDPVPVPFRVPIALRTPQYIMALLGSGRLEFRPKDRYPLWHRIFTCQLRHR